MKNNKKNKLLNKLKNPFLYVSFLLILLFFIPLPEEYNAVKIVISTIVIAYGIKLGAFQKKKSPDEEELEEIEKLEEVEKKFENM